MKNCLPGIFFVLVFALVGNFIGNTLSSAIGCAVIAFFCYLFYAIVTGDAAMEKHWQRLGYRIALIPLRMTEDSPAFCVLIYTEDDNEIRFTGTKPHDIARIEVPSEREWRDTLLDWAQGRRKEILARLKEYQQTFRYYIECPAEQKARQ